MEVHHHSHTERKKWTHYFWEFLMLFLAVFCGFLAENLREHQIEKKREKEYILSMIEDLKEDTSSFKLVIRANTFSCQRIDTLISLLKGREKDASVPEISQLLAIKAIWNNNFELPAYSILFSK